MNQIDLTQKGFLPMGKTVSQFWCSKSQDFPILSNLASRILNVPVSSSVIERTFSKISRFCTKERNCIKSATLAAFVQLNEFEEFEPIMISLYRKYNRPYEPLNWVASDEELQSSPPDYIDGLIEEKDHAGSDSDDSYCINV